MLLDVRRCLGWVPFVSHLRRLPLERARPPAVCRRAAASGLRSLDGTI